MPVPLRGQTVAFLSQAARRSLENIASCLLAPHIGFLQEKNSGHTYTHKRATWQLITPYHHPHILAIHSSSVRRHPLSPFPCIVSSPTPPRGTSAFHLQRCILTTQIVLPSKAREHDSESSPLKGRNIREVPECGRGKARGTYRNHT